jgi:RND family efflux transporter MFP subunit
MRSLARRARDSAAMEDRLMHRLGIHPGTLKSAAAAVLAAAATFLAGCNGAEAPDAAKAAEPAPPSEVSVVEARLEIWPETVRVQGSLMGYERAVIGAKIAGRVDAVPVDLGSKVSRGESLLELDRRELELEVRQAEAQLRQVCAALGMSPEQSETELRRDQAAPVVLEKALVEEARTALARAQRVSGQSISAAEIERLQAQLKTAEARYQSALNGVGEQIALIGLRRADLAIARQRLEDATLIAPFDGVVEQRNVSPGEYLQVGQAVVTLVRNDKLRYTAGVPETKAAAVRPGQKVRIRIDGEPDYVEAAVSRVSPMVHQASRALWIEADVDNPNFRWQAGLFAEAEIVVDPTARTLTVPATAVTEFAGVQKVWTVRDGKALEQPIRTGRREDERVEIVEGLQPSELVVINAREGRAGSVIAVQKPLPPQAESDLPAQSAE